MNVSFRDIRRYYENLYEAMSGESFPFDEERTRILIEPLIASNSANQRCLDIGCGVGYACSLMAEIGSQVFGIDISQAAISEARKRIPNGTFSLAKLSGSIPYNSCFFDSLLCLGVLEHMINPEDIVKESYRVLKIGGKAVFLVPNAYSPYFLFSKGTGQIIEMPRKRQEWVSMFNAAGFDIVKTGKDPGPTYAHYFSPIKKAKLYMNRIFNMLPIDFTYQFIFVLEKI